MLDTEEVINAYDKNVTAVPDLKIQDNIKLSNKNIINNVYCR